MRVPCHVLTVALSLPPLMQAWGAVEVLSEVKPRTDGAEDRPRMHVRDRDTLAHQDPQQQLPLAKAPPKASSITASITDDERTSAAVGDDVCHLGGKLACAQAGVTGERDESTAYQEQEQEQHQEQSKQSGTKEEEVEDLRIEFVGIAQGTLPAPDGENQPQPTRTPGDSDTAGRQQGQQQRRGLASTEGADLPPFTLLKCDGHGFEDLSNDSDLTVGRVVNHMLSRLHDSAQKTGLAALTGIPDRTPILSKDDLHDVDGGDALWKRMLVSVTAPLSYLFSTIASVPGWFSDVTFEVRVQEQQQQQQQGVTDIPQRLVLVQGPPRSLQLVCSALLPTLYDGDGKLEASASYPGTRPTMSSVRRLAEKICLARSPFPGMTVSRPCSIRTTQPAGWSAVVKQTAMGWLGLKNGASSTESSGGGDADIEGRRARAIEAKTRSGPCECASGGVGPCRVRAPPRRSPCLFLEVDDPAASDAEQVHVSSSVGLRSFPLTLANATEAGEAGAWWRNVSEIGIVAKAMGALNVHGAEPAASALFVAVPMYLLRLSLGVVVLFLSRPVSESRLFHYGLAALFGAGLGAGALLLQALANPQRASLRLLLLVGTVTWLVAAVGIDAVPSPTELAHMVPGALLNFWNNGSEAYPWAGKACFGISGLVGVLITRWYGLFLDGEGRRRGSWLNGPTCIRRALKLVGLLFVYHGVSDPEIGWQLVLVALSFPSLVFCARRYSMWSNRSKWYRAGPCLSEAQYEEQGDEYTRRALQELRSSTMDDYSQLRKLKNMASRKRMSAFTKTGEHYLPPSDESGTSRACVLQ